MFFNTLQPYRTITGRKDIEVEKSVLGVNIGTVTRTLRASKNDVSVSELSKLILASAKGPQLAQVLNRFGKY